MRALQQELEELREDRARDRDREQRRQQEHEEELQILRDRCETLEAERANGGGGVSLSISPTYLFSHQCAKADPQLLRQLQSDMQGLMEELTELSRRNDELMTAKDADLAVIHDLDAQRKDYKRKYELAKTELRGLKGSFSLGWQMNWFVEDTFLFSDIPAVPPTTQDRRQLAHVSRWGSIGYPYYRVRLCGR